MNERRFSDDPSMQHSAEEWYSGYKKRQKEANQRGEYFVERIAFKADDQGNENEIDPGHFSVDSKEIQDKAEELFERFRGWVSFNDVLAIAKSEVSLENFIQNTLIPRREEYYKEHPEQLEQDKNFWQKAGVPIEIK